MLGGMYTQWRGAATGLCAYNLEHICFCAADFLEWTCLTARYAATSFLPSVKRPISSHASSRFWAEARRIQLTHRISVGTRLRPGCCCCAVRAILPCEAVLHAVKRKDTPQPGIIDCGCRTMRVVVSPCDAGAEKPNRML